MTHLNNWQTKFVPERPRRLLALDGGGIRGVMSLEILRKIEQDLAKATGKGASFRLGDFFDYVGGTSTGAIIAAGLAMGKSVQELIDFYIEAGPLMFEKTFLIGRLRSFYQADPLRKKLNSVFGERQLGADRFVVGIDSPQVRPVCVRETVLPQSVEPLQLTADH